MKQKPKEVKKQPGTPKTNNSQSDQQDTKAIQQERTFSDWLRSDEGIENLKLFVLGNTILVFIAISWPHMKDALDAAYYIYLEYTEKK